MREEVLAAGAVDGIRCWPLLDLKANNFFVFKLIGNKTCLLIDGDVHLVAPQREVPSRGRVVGAGCCTASTGQIRLLLSYGFHFYVRLSLRHFVLSLLRS